MKNNLLFDFIIDNSENTVFIKREFAAEQILVWNAFTKQEILDQWWAPKPWLSKTRYMNFVVGGRRFYSMCSPDGEEHWSIQEFTLISPITNFKHISSFSDKDENIDINLPSSEWNLEFNEKQKITTVNISIKHKTSAALEKLLEMGFRGGITMIFNELDILLMKY